MRVLYVIDSLVPAGAERSLAALAPHLVDNGVRLGVAYLEDRPGLQHALAAGGASLFCAAGRGGRIGWPPRLSAIVGRFRPDLIHTTLFEADVAGRLVGAYRGIPVVSSLVNLLYGPDHLGDPRLSAWKVRGHQIVDGATARLAVRFHAVSNEVAEKMSRRLRLPRGRVEVIPRGRNVAELGVRNEKRRLAARQALGARPSDAVVVTAARQDFQKGLDVLMDAFPAVLREVPHARLYIAGREGGVSLDLRNMLERHSLNGSVRLLGPRADLADLLTAADAFVLPTRREGFPGVLVEAMALEAPIVATDIRPVREVVGSDGVATLVPPEDRAALARGLVNVLVSRTAARSATKRGRARFLENFTSETVAERMIGFYERALGQGRRRRGAVNVERRRAAGEKP